MDNKSALQLQQFISDNNLASHKRITLFDAVITYYHNGNPVNTPSEVQIITLPKEMVLYVLEFVKDIQHESEIYSTSSYYFSYTGNNIMEIRDASYNDLLLFSIMVLNKVEANTANR